MTREDKVNEFRKAAGKLNYDDCPEEADMITDAIEEEFDEFAEAAVNWENEPNEKYRAELVKEWADLAYVVSQAALYYNIPADAAFNRVHENNMTKVVDGKVIFREDGKILKPEGYQKPNMSGL